MTRADVAAATPVCPRSSPGWRGACGALLSWEQAHAAWSCPTHGEVWTAEALVAAQRDTRTPVAPAAP